MLLDVTLLYEKCACGRRTLVGWVCDTKLSETRSVGYGVCGVCASKVRRDDYKKGGG